MKKTLFFPGCTLKNEAKDFESSAMAAMEALGSSLIEMERWNCCGTLYSTTEDDLMHQLAPVRNLIRVQESGADRMVTACAMCYNTQKRANLRVKRNPDELEKINAFMNLEEDYKGEVEVVHLLEILRDEIGFPAVQERVKRPLDGLKVASYYGCMLLRPKESAIDPPQEPRVLEDLSIALGAEAVDYPYKSKCCGSYHTVDNRALAVKAAQRILVSAREARADVIITACPLCQHNLEEGQVALREAVSEYEEISIVYFTQLMALALGVQTGELPGPLKEKLDIFTPAGGKEGK